MQSTNIEVYSTRSKYMFYENALVHMLKKADRQYPKYIDSFALESLVDSEVEYLLDNDYMQSGMFAPFKQEPYEQLVMFTRKDVKNAILMLMQGFITYEHSSTRLNVSEIQ